VIELSVFLEMGGTSKAIELSLLTCITHEVGGGNASVTQEQWLEYFGQFDARNATCLLRADQERLLMTIEAGFGGCAALSCVVARQPDLRPPRPRTSALARVQAQPRVMD